MNPSYDNGFGSFGSGGAMPSGGAPVGGASVGGAPSPVPPVTPVSTTPAQSTPVTPVQPVSPMQSVQPMPVGLGGDVVVGGAPEKKSKKGLVVGLVVCVVILAIVGVVVAVAVVMLNMPKSESARDKFNKLMNYVVSGEVSAANYTGTFSNSASYYFDTQQENIENRAALYASTSALLDDFMTTYNGLADKSKFSSNAGEFESTMSAEKDILGFSRIIGEKALPDIFDVAGFITDDGGGNIDNYANYYDFSALKNNRYVNGFSSLFTEYMKRQTTLASVYGNDDCLSGNTIRNSCLTDLANETYDTLSKEIDNYGLELSSYYSLVEFFVPNLFDMNNLIVMGGSNA